MLFLYSGQTHFLAIPLTHHHSGFRVSGLLHLSFPLPVILFPQMSPGSLHFFQIFTQRSSSLWVLPRAHHLIFSLILYLYPMHFFSSVQSLSHVRLFATPWTAACQASLSITNSWRLLKLMSIMSVMPFNHLILCHPLLLPLSIFPRKVFSNELVLRIR